MRVSIANRQRKVKLPLGRIEKGARKAASELGLGAVELSVLFASPQAVRKLNLQYRGKDSTTDVLSFPLHDFGGSAARCRRAAAAAWAGGAAEPLLLGDIVIDPARAERQAREYGHSPGDEIMRLVIHGLLHLLGHDHECGGYLAGKMAKAERELIRALGLKSVLGQ